MSRRNYFEDLEYEALAGVDTTTPLGSIQPGRLIRADNTDLGLTSGFSKRNGYVSQLNSAWGSRVVIAGAEYRNSGGTSQTVIYGQDGTDGRLAYINAGVPTNIKTGLDKAARPTLVQFKDSLFSYNGVDAPFLYDGSVTRQVGITAPTIAPTISSQTTGGSLTLLAPYLYAYTYYNSATGAESSPSALSPQAILTGTNCKIVVGLTAGDSSTADTIRIWRTVGNGNQLFLDGTAAISATSYNSTAADTALTIAMELDNTRITILSSTAKFPIVAQNRIFLVTGDNEIRYSKIGQVGPMPESFQVAAVITTVGHNGNADTIVGTGSINDIPIVIKKNSVGRLDQVGLQQQTSTIDPVYYNYTEISNLIGGISHWAGCQVLNEYVWISRDNIYATNSASIRKVGDSIVTTIKNLGFSNTQITKISAANYIRNKQVFFSLFTSGSATVPAYVLVGDYKVSDARGLADFRWTMYAQGPNTTTWPGIQAACFFPVTNTTDGSVSMWFGNSNSNGKVYKMDTGTNDDGFAIYHKVITRPYYGTHPFFTKLFKTVRVLASGNGNAYNLAVSTIYDLSGQETNSLNISLASGQALWDNSVWDNFLWADTSITPIRYDPHQKAFYQQLVFIQSDLDAPVSVLGWGTSGSLFRP